MASEKSAREQVVKLLDSLTEPELRTTLVVPFFKRLFGDARDICGKGEGEHRLDVLAIDEDELGNPLLCGVQIKKTEETAATMSNDSQSALLHPFGEFGGALLYQFYWIQMGSIGVAKRASFERLAENRGISKRVQLWTTASLVDKIIKTGCSDILPALELIDFKRRAEEHEESREFLFSAHYCYRMMRWHLEYGNDPNTAKEVIAKAAQLVQQERNSRLYYSRTLFRFYEIWRDLLDKWPEDTCGKNYFKQLTAKTNRHRLRNQLGPAGAKLWIQMEVLLAQLDLLSEIDIVGQHTNLSILQLTRLLLRAGVPPKLHRAKTVPISLRLEKIQEDLRREKGKSLDGECSLCTATAVSCCVLANQRKSVEQAVEWLRSLKEHNYCYQRARYTKAKPHERALHYASVVLCGFNDYYLHLKSEERIQVEDLEDASKLFFMDGEIGAAGFYKNWMTYRNIDRFEICRYIFFAFLRLYLSGERLSSKKASPMLRKGLKNLMTALKTEAEDAIDPSVPYSVRTNLTSFNLGRILGVPHCGKRADSIVGRLMSKAQVLYGSRRLLDSSIHRTRVVVEGCISYWETKFYMEENGVASAEEPS